MYGVKDSSPLYRPEFISKREEGDIWVPRPVDNQWRSNNIFHRNETPVSAVERVIAVVTHTETVISLNSIARCRLVVNRHDLTTLFNRMPFALDEGAVPCVGGIV